MLCINYGHDEKEQTEMVCDDERGNKRSKNFYQNESQTKKRQKMTNKDMNGNS